MITSLRRMVTCHWSARRISRYLDNDPAAPLSRQEAQRLEEHLAICRRCAAVAQEQRMVRLALARWSGERLPDPESLARLHAALDRITKEEA